MVLGVSNRENPFHLNFLCFEWKFWPEHHPATMDKRVHFHPKCVRSGLVHLAFADDIPLFARGDYPSVKVL